MKRGKTKIVLDADVVIHFSKGGMLSLLPDIFPDYEYVLLDIVRGELQPDIRMQVDNQIGLLKNITPLPFNPRGEMLREYARLRSRFNMGKGESACMAYCKFNHDVIGSSNLRDIREYCEKEQIVYLTTVDFLWYAWRKGMVTTSEVAAFVKEVKAKGSKLPDVEIEKYICRQMI